jgi:hypothetical protein
MTPKKTIRITLSGIVIPTDWDEEGKTIAVSLSTEDENIVLLADKVSKEDLFQLMQKEVEISGRLIAAADHKTIAVEDYMLKKSWQ